MTKTCTKCKIEQPIENFRTCKQSNGKIYVSTICTTCKNKIDREYHQKHKEETATKNKAKRQERKIERDKRNAEILADGGVLGNFHRVGLAKINEFVKEKHNGKCLSTTYKNGKQKLLFECKWGHQWDAIWTNIQKGRWCPQCSSFVGERITRIHFETIFDNKFNRAHPEWLRNDNGYKMELDGYCAELGIAFEHHGMQHYKINEFCKTQEELEKRQKDDQTKIRLCQENGVKLIIIPQVPDLTPTEKLKLFIIERCQKLDISISKNVDELSINFDLEPIQMEYLKRYQEIAISKGGKCLSTVYINSGSKLSFECKEGHKWDAIPDNISGKNSWCPHCNKEGGGKKKKGK